MDTKVIESRVVGECYGYEYRRVFTLEDGSRWIQESITREYRLKTRPIARVWPHPYRSTIFFLDLEGTSDVVEVLHYDGPKWQGIGAF